MVINNVSFRTGRKFENHISDHYKLREISDAVCRKHHKAILENAPFYGGGKKRYWIEKSGQITHRDMLRRDIDEAIVHSYKESSFIGYLESLGYEFIRGMDYQHPSVKAPTWKRPIRIDSLGKDYTRDAINERLYANLGKGLRLETFVQPSKKRRPLLIVLEKYTQYRQPDGFTIFFQLIVAVFRWIAGIPQNEARHNAPISPEMRAAWRKIEQISEEVQFLSEHHIVTETDFHAYEDQVDNRIRDLEQERQKLRNKLRRVKSPEEEQSLKEQCKAIALQIMPYRADKHLCERIKKRQPELKQAVELEFQMERGTQRQQQLSYRKDYSR